MKLLIKDLPLMNAAYESMKLGVESFVNDIDDRIYSACIQGSSGGGIPAVGSISDKTGKIALQINYSSRDDIKQLQADIVTLKNVIDSVGNALKILTQTQKLIMDLRYPGNGEESAWKDVAAELTFSIGHIRKIFDYSVKRMIIAAQISVDTYLEVLQIMDGWDN
ncbi:MAG TPA: hypothetical protein VHP38_02235 [Ruminiclostridium sp.]|nr:hypothetical protein [Ruminiclostridium sp.]